MDDATVLTAYYKLKRGWRVERFTSSHPGIITKNLQAFADHLAARDGYGHRLHYYEWGTRV
jgi:hypothetical protein